MYGDPTMEPTLLEWVSALGAIVGSLLLGFVFAKLLERRLHRAAALTAVQADDLLAAALRPLLVWWFGTAGLFAAKLILAEHLTPRWDALASRVLLTLLIGSITVAIAQMAADTVRLVALRSQGVRSSSSLFITLTRITIYLLGALVLLQSLGVRITPLLGALGVGGIAVALALQPTLSNVFSGIQLLASGTVRPGDFVELDGRQGVVTDVNWRYTTIRGLPNNLTIVPNSRLSDAIFTNYSLPSPEMSITVPCGVAYGSDLAHVERVAVEVAREAMAEHPARTPAFDPFVRFRAFADSAIEFDTILRVTEFADQYVLRHDFIKRLHARFAAEGIRIPFPQRVVHLPERSG